MQRTLRWQRLRQLQQRLQSGWLQRSRRRQVSSATGWCQDVLQAVSVQLAGGAFGEANGQ